MELNREFRNTAVHIKTLDFIFDSMSEKQQGNDSTFNKYCWVIWVTMWKK